MNNYGMDIETVYYAHVTKLTTVCTFQCKNGYEMTGVFCCKYEMQDDKKFREQKAYENAMRYWERNIQRIKDNGGTNQRM
ncbi:MAG: hypothetical protein ACYDG2_23745 [Ruminiclostridium sp.]